MWDEGLHTPERIVKYSKRSGQPHLLKKKKKKKVKKNLLTKNKSKEESTKTKDFSVVELPRGILQVSRAVSL